MIPETSVLLSETLAQTQACAVRLAEAIRQGDLVFLDGPLGSGKTTFIRFFVEALGGDPSCVSSPTFTLLHHYDASLAVAHVDAYRLESSYDLESLGFDELAEEGVGCIEWSQKIQPDVDESTCWRLCFEHVGDESSRRITVHVPMGRNY